MNTCQWDWMLITCQSSFLDNGQIFAKYHSFGISSVSRDCWNKFANTGPSSTAGSLRILWWSDLGPLPLMSLDLLEVKLSLQLKQLFTHPIKQENLTKLILSEYTCKLPIKFLCQIRFRLSQPHFHLPISGVGCLDYLE